MEEQQTEQDSRAVVDASPLTPAPPKKNHKGAKRVSLLLLALALLAAAAAGGYWWRDQAARSELGDKSAKISDLQAEVASLKKAAETSGSSGSSESSGGTTCAAIRPSEATVESIKSAITSGNTAALEGYMAPSVNVIYAASDGLGQRTAANAVSDITSFISNPSEVTWNFVVADAKIAAFQQSSYKLYFPDTALVGEASDERLLSFTFDCEGKISGVLLVMDEATLTQ